jgi:hypothetical protein
MGGKPVGAVPEPIRGGHRSNESATGPGPLGGGLRRTAASAKGDGFNPARTDSLRDTA